MKFFKIILPAILCVIIIYITKMSIYYYPLSFGIIIGLTNWKRHKYNPFFGVILSILVSYIAFFIAYFSGEIVSPLINFILDNINYSKSDEKRGIIILTILAFIFAPLLVFFLYKFVFKIPRTKLTLLIIISCIILLAFNFIFFMFYSEPLLKDYTNSKIINPYTIWQIVMALAIQIIITQKTHTEVVGDKSISKQ